MHAAFRPCLPLALLILAACSPNPDGQAAIAPASTPAPATPVVAPSREEPDCSDEQNPRADDKRPRCGDMIATSTVPRAYHVASEGGECVIEGDACDLEKPFKLSGCGIKDYYTFTPESALAGSFTYQGNMMGARVSGAGDYTVDAGEHGGSIQTAASRNCAAGGGAVGCNGINIRFKLTPIAACGAAS